MHESTGTNKLLNKYIESKGISPAYRRAEINEAEEMKKV